MYRYIAFAWDAGSGLGFEPVRALTRRLQQSSPEWRRIFDSAGLAVWHAGERAGSSEAYRLAGAGGVILGHVFRRCADLAFTSAPTDLNEAESDAIVSSSGRQLLATYWGRYVAFLRDEPNSRVYVLRDPTAALPCLLMQRAGVSIFASRPQDLLDLGLPSFSINWEYLAAHIAFHALQIRESGLAEVSEIVGGECVEIRGGSLRRTLHWQPSWIVESDPIESAADAVTELRRTTQACINAWASCYHAIVHTLSGGLDSSIVLSCLASGPAQPRIACLNYVTQEEEGDERVWARAAARAASCELIEHTRDAARLRLEPMLKVTPFVRPWSYRYSLEHSQLERQVAQQVGAGAVFSGAGGDQIFYQARASLAASDYLYRHGMHPGLARVAWDAARVEGRSIWAVLRSAIRDHLRRRGWDPLTEAGKLAKLASADSLRIAQDRNRFAHPWFAGSSGRPIGKHWQVHTLSLAHSFYDPFESADDPERVHPIISQPLMELCLRIPTYVLISGGWDRAIARRAFSESVPHQIISRRTKGALNEHSLKLLKLNLPFIREMLLDGELVKHGLLDRSSLESMLDSRNAMPPRSFGELESHLSTEIWLRRWREQRQRAAA